MSLTALFATAFAVALSGAMGPGPVLIASVRHSAERGRWAGPLVVIGHAVVEVPLMIAIIVGLQDVLRSKTFAGVIGLAGGGVMIAMGAAMLWASRGLKLPLNGSDAPSHAVHGAAQVVVAGALTSILNPHFVIWWATVGLAFMAYAAPHGARGYLVFYGGHVLADLAWYWAISEAVHRGRRLLSGHSYRWLIGTCAVLLMGFALVFACHGWDSLTRD